MSFYNCAYCLQPLTKEDRMHGNTTEQWYKEWHPEGMTYTVHLSCPTVSKGPIKDIHDYDDAPYQREPYHIKNDTRLTPNETCTLADPCEKCNNKWDI